jgi:hypothetical protein
MKKRDTDDDPRNVTHFRAGSRIFHSNNEWYFSSREGEHGPWRSEQEAARELETYIELTGLNQESKAFKATKQPVQPNADPKVWDRFDNFN